MSNRPPATPEKKKDVIVKGPSTPKGNNKRPLESSSPAAPSNKKSRVPAAAVDEAGTVEAGANPEGAKAQSDAEESEDDSGSDASEASVASPVPVETKKKRQKITVTQPVGQAARAPHCPFCYEEFGEKIALDRRVPPFGPCPVATCALVMNIGFDDSVNVAIRSRLEKKGTATTPAVVAAADFSRREQELTKIAGLGPTYPLYEPSAIKLTDEEIDAKLRCSFMSEDHEVRPSGSLALIRSGKIPFFSMLKWRTSTEVIAEAAASAAATPAANAIYVVPFTPCADLNEFNQLMLRLILPCLVGREAATVEWLSFAATVQQLDTAFGWTYTLAYINDVISTATRTRAPFAEVNQRLIQTITVKYAIDATNKLVAKKATPSAAAASKPASSPSSSRRQPGTAAQSCHSFNFSKAGCSNPPDACSSGVHQCAYKFKRGKDGLNCPDVAGEAEHTGYKCTVHVHPGPRTASTPTRARSDRPARDVVKRGDRAEEPTKKEA